MSRQDNAVNEQFRTCSNCEVELPVEEFYSSRPNWCKACVRGESKERMKRFRSTYRGKAYQTLTDTRKARKKVEARTGESIRDDLSIHAILFTLSAEVCEYCGIELDVMEAQLDHIVPMKYGGTNTFDNVACACAWCNRSKNDRPVYDFLMESANVSEMQALVERVASRRRVSYDQVLAEWSEQSTEYHLNDIKSRVDRVNKKEDVG